MATKPKKRKSVEKCLTPGCGKPRRTRGLCVACNSTARRRVKSGEVSEEWLIEHNAILPARPPGPTGAFGRHIESLLNK